MVVLLKESFDKEQSINKKRRIRERFDDSSNILINPVQQYFGDCMVAPDFNCACIVNKEIQRIQLSNLFQKYKAIALFFYKGDFTESACKDLTLINNHIQSFQSLYTIPLAMSTDTEISHLEFINSTLGFTPSFPLVCDQTHSVSRHFNIIQSNNDTNRAVFIIDKTRKIRFSFVIEDDRISHSMNTICSILQTF